MSLGLSMAASINHSQLLVSFSGSQEGQEGNGQRRLLGWGSRGGVPGPLAHTGLCTQACGPTAHRACAENMYTEGACLLLDSRLQSVRTLPAAEPGRSVGTWILCGARVGSQDGQSVRPASEVTFPVASRAQGGWKHGLSWQEEQEP